MIILLKSHSAHDFSYQKAQMLSIVPHTIHNSLRTKTTNEVNELSLTKEIITHSDNPIFFSLKISPLQHEHASFKNSSFLLRLCFFFCRFNPLRLSNQYVRLFSKLIPTILSKGMSGTQQVKKMRSFVENHCNIAIKAIYELTKS